MRSNYDLFIKCPLLGVQFTKASFFMFLDQIAIDNSVTI